MFKRKYQYLTTIITNGSGGLSLQKVYGSEAVAKQKKNNIKLHTGKTLVMIIISIIMAVCGIGAVIHQPSFLADVLLSVFSGLLTGLILLLYSGYNARLREDYNSKAQQLENVSKEILSILNSSIFNKYLKQNGVVKDDPIDENIRNADSISQINDICKFVIKLNGNENIEWLNKKNKFANDTYSDLLLYACIMQNRMGTAMVKPTTKQSNHKTIEAQELCDYLTKAFANLSQYKNTIDRITVQIKQQIISFDKSLL